MSKVALALPDREYAAQFQFASVAVPHRAPGFRIRRPLL